MLKELPITKVSAEYIHKQLASSWDRIFRKLSMYPCCSIIFLSFTDYLPHDGPYLSVDVAERIVFWVIRKIWWAVLVFEVQTNILLRSSSKKKYKWQEADSLISLGWITVDKQRLYHIFRSTAVSPHIPSSFFPQRKNIYFPKHSIY